MSQEMLEQDKTIADGHFDRVVQLISECVVIKAQLQQYMEGLSLEKQRYRAVVKHAADLGAALVAAQKGGTLAGVIKESEALQQEIKAARLDAVNAGLEEAVGHFGKVMGDLQHHLVKMNLGAASISILQVLLVRIDGQIYALAIENVLEILKVKKTDIYSVDGTDTISLRGHALGVIDVSQVIGMPNVGHKELADRKIVVITDGTNQIGVMVDDLLGEESVVFKALPVQVRGLKGLRGASILGDGKVGLIIDAAQLISMAAGKE